MGALRLKICGLAQKEDAALAIELGAWALGFIFYPPSPRFVRPEEVGRILDELRTEGYLLPKTVGVFVDSSPESIRDAVAKSGVDTIQLHGDETPDRLRELEDLSIIKAFRMKHRGQLSSLASYEAGAEAFLFDAAVPGAYGGTGHQADWDLLGEVKSDKPFILSGGLKQENVREAIQRFSHKLYALDLSSGVEERPGIKDHQKLKSLFKEVGASHAFST